MRPEHSAELCVFAGDIIYIILHNDIDISQCLLRDRFRSHTCVCTTTTMMQCYYDLQSMAFNPD